MRAQLISTIDAAIGRTQSLRSASADPLLNAFLEELQRYRAMVSNHWPLTDRERASIDIGRVAVREFESTDPDYVTLLCELARHLKEQG